MLAATRRRIEGTREDFAEALRALTDAVASTIPHGRVYAIERSPRIVLGSLVSGVGIAEAADGVVVVRGSERLGRLWP